MTPAIRISIGIVALTTSLLLTIDWFLDVFPDPYAPALESRQILSESLAIQYSASIASNHSLGMQQAMESVVETVPEVLSMSLLRSNGDLVASTAQHAEMWVENGTDRSTPTQVLIPIFNGDTRWGVLKVKFDVLPDSGLSGMLRTPLYKLVAIMAVAGFLIYMAYLSRVLRYLDPSAVVPGRVQSALDQFVEGVFILDQNECIVLVNLSFAKKVGLSQDSLIGMNPSTLSWFTDEKGRQSDEMPWTTAIRAGTRLADVRLELELPDQGVRIFNINVSPIIDEDGEKRGALASLTDISDLELMNERLRKALKNVEMAHEDVRLKNEELFRLASIDYMTGCLNRRAFFERLEAEFLLAKREGLELSVIVADIDRFKEVNYDFGHSVSDDVIVEVARALKSQAGPNDSICRFGSDEFCMLVVGRDAISSMLLIDQIESALEGLFQFAGSQTGGRAVTLSFGITTISAAAESVEELLQQASAALNASKNSGRNHVTHWSETEVHLRKAS